MVLKELLLLEEFKPKSSKSEKWWIVTSEEDGEPCGRIEGATKIEAQRNADFHWSPKKVIVKNQKPSPIKEGLKDDLAQVVDFLESNGFEIITKDKSSVLASKARRRDVKIFKDSEGWLMQIRIGGKFAADGEATRNGKERWLGVESGKNLGELLSKLKKFAKKYL